MVGLDRERFLSAVSQVGCGDYKRDGIGTLSEGSVHAVLKKYFEPENDAQEVKIGSFVADIAGENGIIEIQTRALHRLIKKLDCFLEYTHVTVVYPIPKVKYVRWADPETGELSKRRRSPKQCSIYDAFSELVKIKYALQNPRFTFVAVLIEAEDIRLLDGYSASRKKGATKIDRVPTDIFEEYRFECEDDYMMLVPYELEGEFTSKDFAKAAGIKRELAATTLNVLSYIGVTKKTGKRGRENIYTVSDDRKDNV